MDMKRLEAHSSSASSYLKSSQQARAKFETTGDLGQQDWADKYLLAARLHAATVGELGGVVTEPELQPEAPVLVETMGAAPVEQVKVRCSFYKHIRRFMAVARERGLDISGNARDRMRGALGMLLGRRIESRADLSGPEWELCTNALRSRSLFW